MPQYFDPMSSMNALAGGAQIGGAIRDKQTQNALSPMVAKGDYKSAMEYAGSRGDLGQVQDMKTQYKGQLDAEQKARQTGILRLGMSLLQTPLEQRNPAQVAQNLAQFGVEVDPSQLGDLSDASIQSVMASVQDEESLMKQYAEMTKAQDPYTLSADQVRFGGNDKEVARGPAKPAPEPKYETWEDGSRLMTGVLSDPTTYREIGAVQPAGGGAGGAAKYGLNIIYAEDENGNMVPLQASNDGQALARPNVPDGLTVQSPYDRAYDQTAGKEQAKTDAYQTAAGMKVLSVEEDFTRFSAQIDSAIEKSTKGNTGLLGQFMPSPDLDALLETIEAGTAFTSLVDLKSQGGTLGALSETELDLLKAKVANVRRSQSDEQLDANLEILKFTMENSVRRVKQAYEAEYESGRYGSAMQQGQQSPGLGGQGAVGPSGQPGAEIDGADNVPEGALVEDENGIRWRKQNGQLVRAD